MASTMFNAIIGTSLAVSPVIAFAQTAAPAPVAPAAATAYSTASTQIGTLLDDPAARTVLETHLPQLAMHPQIEQARPMTLVAIQSFAPEIITDEKLALIDRDLAALPARP